MDSSGIQSSTSTSMPSNRKRKAKVSTIIQSRRAKFFETYLPQDFSLPDSVMFYLAKNPTSPDSYQKMVRTCKDFFVKNPVLVTSEFSHCGDGKWQISDAAWQIHNSCPCINLSEITSKFWITYRLSVHPRNSVSKKPVNKNILSSLMPKLYQCIAKTVTIVKQILSFHDLTRLISSAEKIEFFGDVIVKDENGLNVAFEKIAEVAVKAKDILVDSDTTLSNITPDTMKNLIKLPNFLKLDKLTLFRIPEIFDLETYYAYMKKNKTNKIWLIFDVSISEVYINRLEEIVDEILATETHDYMLPYIDFSELDQEKADILFDISP